MPKLSQYQRQEQTVLGALSELCEELGVRTNASTAETNGAERRGYSTKKSSPTVPSSTSRTASVAREKGSDAKERVKEDAKRRDDGEGAGMATVMNRIQTLLAQIKSDDQNNRNHNGHGHAQASSSTSHSDNSSFEASPTNTQSKKKGLGGSSLSSTAIGLGDGETAAHQLNTTQPANSASSSLTLMTLIPNALVTTHVSSTLFIMMDALASSVRASWGMLFVYNATLGKLVLASSCGQRYARPGSVTIAVNTSHFQPSLVAAAVANSLSTDKSPFLRPKPPTQQRGGGGEGDGSPLAGGGGGSSSNTIESHVMETGIGVNLSISSATSLGLGGGGRTSNIQSGGSGETINNNSKKRRGLTANAEDLDGLYYAREMSSLSRSGAAGGVEHSSVKSTDTYEAKVRLSAEVAKAHRTRNLLVLPIFRPGSQNTEVIGLLELGNKVPDTCYVDYGDGGGDLWGTEDREDGDDEGETSHFRPPAGSSEVIPFSEEDECRAVEAAAFFANIMAKYPYDLGHRNSHNHGINDQLAALVAGLPTPSYYGGNGSGKKDATANAFYGQNNPTPAASTSQGTSNSSTKGKGVQSNTSAKKDSHSDQNKKLQHTYFNYFGASVLRTSSMRSPQLIYRSDRQQRIATVKKSELKQGATLVSFKGGSDEWRELTISQQQQQQRRRGGGGDVSGAEGSGEGADEATASFATGSSFTAAQQPPPIPRAPSHHSGLPAAMIVQPPAYLPQLPNGATVTDVIEHTLEMGESWRNAVMLNVELETEVRRLHEALRISRREIARLQDMLFSTMRRSGGGQTPPQSALLQQQQEQHHRASSVSSSQQQQQQIR